MKTTQNKVIRTIEPHVDLGVAAFLMGMSKRWVRDKVKNGDLEGYMFGNKMVVTVASVNVLRDRTRVSPTPHMPTPAQ